jgi:hypothetical protein
MTKRCMMCGEPMDVHCGDIDFTHIPDGATCLIKQVQTRDATIARLKADLAAANETIARLRGELDVAAELLQTRLTAVTVEREQHDETIEQLEAQKRRLAQLAAAVVSYTANTDGSATITIDGTKYTVAPLLTLPRKESGREM